MAEDNRRIAFLKDALSKLAKSVREVSAGLIDLEKVISRITGKTRDFAKANKEAATSVNKTSKSIKDSTASMKANESQTNKTTKANKGFFGNIGKNLKTIVSFYGAYQVLNLALSAFLDLTVGSAKRAIALEKSLADLRAVAGLTTQDIGRLRDVVFEVAGTTSLTATEVVELQKALAKLGSSTEEIENLTQPIALLSQALGEDAGGVANVLKKTLNQFQATSEEAGNFANILTGAVNETALSMNDLGTALGYVGPLGAQLGVSFEETAALLGILADNGFKASKAGTGLRSFFIAAAKDGRPFNEFLEDVGNRSLTATESVEVFGKVAASQALVLGENVDRFKELSMELTESDRLFKANAIQMASTEGQLQLLNSAYDKFSTNLGTVITQTDLFIGLISFLNRETAAQARAYKIVANATDEQNESLSTITESLTRFNRESSQSEGQIQAVSEAFDLLDLSTQGIDKDDFLKNFNEQLKETGTVQEALTNIGEEWNNVSKQTAINLRELIELSYQQSKGIDEAYIAQEANNESVKRYKQEYAGLLSLTREGISVDEEKKNLQAQISNDILKYSEELRQLESEGPAREDEVRILEKRIALLTEQSSKLGDLSVAEETLAQQRKTADKEAENRIKGQLNDYIERIKETEKVIGDLTVELGESAFPDQVDLLNGFFGSAEDIIAEATERFGADSEFVKSLIATLKGAAEEVSIQLPKEAGETLDLAVKGVFGDGVDLTPELPKIVEPIEETALTLSEKLKEAFAGVKLAEVIAEGLDKTAESIEAFNDVALENTKASADAQLAVIEERYNIEGQILKSQLDNQLITESQFRVKQKELQKAKIAEQNAIDKKVFDAEKKRDRQNATTDYLQSLASIIPNLIVYDKEGNPVKLAAKAAISAGLTTAAYGAELAAISQKKFFPKKFEQGGVVNGPSHSEGGVPFTVQGKQGYEMEGGEFIVNKKATAMHRDLLERINNSQRTRPQIGKMKFADGGLVGASPVDESVDYLKAIAEATTSTAVGVSKPVRAYVADKDLRSNATERRLRDRNDRI